MRKPLAILTFTHSRALQLSERGTVVSSVTGQMERTRATWRVSAAQTAPGAASWPPSPRAADPDAESCERWARLPYEILILGETGTGKTVLARRLHELSGRGGPCVTCSLAELPDELATSLLFGHAKGVYTGAHDERAGIIEGAHKGTVILEEISKASLRVQGMLLRVVEEKKVVRLGEQRERPVDFRLVAVSNQDLDAMAERGEFLEDLRARFGYYVLWLPPLREQRDRIPPLTSLFLEAESAAIGRERPPVLTAEARELLFAAPWRQNIRELRNVCAYVAGTASGSAGTTDLPPAFLRTLGIERSGHPEPLEARVHRALSEAGGNKAKAARALGMSRGRLYRLLAVGAVGSA